jgi:hypothetical protein
VAAGAAAWQRGQLARTCLKQEYPSQESPQELVAVEAALLVGDGADVLGAAVVLGAAAAGGGRPATLVPGLAVLAPVLVLVLVLGAGLLLMLGVGVGVEVVLGVVLVLGVVVGVGAGALSAQLVEAGRVAKL